jgi:PASTA domain
MLRFRGFSADKRAMSLRIDALLTRAAVLVLIGLAATATLTYAAGRNIGAAAPSASTAAAAPATVLVPDVRNQAFVFAKGALEDAGLAWHVAGGVHGYSSNTVVDQSPAPGTKLLDTGAPLVTLTLKRTPGYQELGAAEDSSPYAATADQRADLAVRVAPAAKPAVTVPTTTTPAVTTPAQTTPASTTATTPARTPAKHAQKPAARPAAFVVPGARTEPLDEIPLTVRAQNLDAWVAAHTKPTDANVKYWLYQHVWIVTGARLGWWRGAEALQTLIAVDRRAQQLWGIGSKSASVAASALSEVQSRSK